MEGDAPDIVVSHPAVRLLIWMLSNGKLACVRESTPRKVRVILLVCPIPDKAITLNMIDIQIVFIMPRFRLLRNNKLAYNLIIRFVPIPENDRVHT
jgi:hypothetical protein